MRARNRAAGPSRRGVLATLAALALGLRPGRPASAQPVPPPTPRPATPVPPPPGSRPGVPAPPAVVEEVRAIIARAVERFEARDLDGVLAHVSEEYWTGPFGKRTVRAQLLAIYQIHQQVRVRVQLDEVRLVGPHAWVWTTGDVAGQLTLVGQWLGLFAWEREIEVARREQGVWRLYGYQQ